MLVLTGMRTLKEGFGARRGLAASRGRFVRLDSYLEKLRAGGLREKVESEETAEGLEVHGMVVSPS